MDINTHTRITHCYMHITRDICILLELFKSRCYLCVAVTVQYMLAFTKIINWVGLQISKDHKRFLNHENEKSRTRTSFFVNFLIFHGKINCTWSKNDLYFMIFNEALLLLLSRRLSFSRYLSQSKSPSSFPFFIGES